MSPLFTREHRTLSGVAGPLIFVEQVSGVGAGELVRVVAPDGTTRDGQVLELSGDRAVIQVFQSTRGLDLEQTRGLLGFSVLWTGEQVGQSEIDRRERDITDRAVVVESRQVQVGSTHEQVQDDERRGS